MKKKIVCVLLGMMMALGTTACGGDQLSSSSVNLNEGYEGKQTEQEELPDTEQETGDIEDEEMPEEGTTEVTFSSGYADFSVTMLKNTAKPGTNTMISPLSILTALTMTENGAAGETLTQMEEVLFGGMPVAQQNEELTAYISSLPDTEKCHMNQANSIWVKNSNGTLAIREEFLQKNADTFDADIYSAPFDAQTLKDINTWVARETDNMIPQMLNQIDPTTVMYLINAVAFEAEWQSPYGDYQVRDSEFYQENGGSETVEMMYSEEHRYLEDADTTGFIKPYKEGYSFVALLPKDGMSMEDYLDGLTGEKYMALMENQGIGVTVDTGLPKFTSEYTAELKDILAEMGMPLAFDEWNADFSGIGSCGDGNLYISMVLHKTYVSVDELGTKAGAATAVAMNEATAVMPEEPKRVILDRPFVYAIVDNENYLPVFIGVVETVEK